MTREESEKSFWVSIISGTLFSVFGVYLIFKPYATKSILAKGIAIVLLCIAIFGLFRYITRKDKTKKIDVNVIYAVVALILSLILFFKPLAISGFIPLALGGYTLTNTFLKVGFLKQLAKNEVKDFGTCIFTFIIMLLLSIVIIFNPLKSVLNMNQTTGMILIFYSILDIISCYLFKNNIN